MVQPLPPSEDLAWMFGQAQQQVALPADQHDLGLAAVHRPRRRTNPQRPTRPRAGGDAGARAPPKKASSGSRRPSVLRAGGWTELQVNRDGEDVASLPGLDPARPHRAAGFGNCHMLRMTIVFK
jgi:hypothetical protein